MADRVPLSSLYTETRQRLAEFVLARPQSWDALAPATPGWTVHDVIAHLTGVAEDLAGGWFPTGGATEEWTAGHVARGRDVAVPDLLEKWEKAVPTVQEILDSRPLWPVVLDVGAHEQDARGGVGD